MSIHVRASPDLQEMLRVSPGIDGIFCRKCPGDYCRFRLAWLGVADSSYNRATVIAGLGKAGFMDELRVLMVGDSRAREFCGSLELLRASAEVASVKDLAEAVSLTTRGEIAPDLIVLAQGFPRQFRAGLVEQLRASIPTAHFVALLEVGARARSVPANRCRGCKESTGTASPDGGPLSSECWLRGDVRTGGSRSPRPKMIARWPPRDKRPPCPTLAGHKQARLPWQLLSAK